MHHYHPKHALVLGGDIDLQDHIHSTALLVEATNQQQARNRAATGLLPYQVDPIAFERERHLRNDNSGDHAYWFADQIPLDYTLTVSTEHPFIEGEKISATYMPEESAVLRVLEHRYNKMAEWQQKINPKGIPWMAFKDIQSLGDGSSIGLLMNRFKEAKICSLDQAKSAILVAIRLIKEKAQTEQAAPVLSETDELMLSIRHACGKS